VDFDDCLSGPAIQDFWMLLSGDREQMTVQLLGLLSGYREFADFDLRELHLIEPLRTLRLLNYAAWLAQRWSDPTFPKNFPWFNTRHYWEEHLQLLREQAAMLEEPALSLSW
jgi:Ser/Thr protein kinase RdoA (MazF antagonist)